MAQIEGIRGVQGPETASTKARRVEPRNPATEVSDKVEIAARTEKIAEVARVTELAKASPDIRTDLVEEAKLKVASGEYLRPEVTDAVAKKIVDSL